MTYSLTLHGLGATGDRFAIGQEVTAKFIPRGVNAANQAGVFAALDAAMAQTGVFRSPSYRGWGSGTNAGLVVFKAYTKTDAYTAQQVADMMKSVVAATTRTLGVVRLATSTITHPTPHGPAVVAAPAAPAELPGGSGPVEQPPTHEPPAAQPDAATEEPGFFTRKVGGVPVWAIGAGVGTLGIVAVGAALLMRKKPAASLVANIRKAADGAASVNEMRIELERLAEKYRQEEIDEARRWFLASHRDRMRPADEVADERAYKEAKADAEAWNHKYHDTTKGTRGPIKRLMAAQEKMRGRRRNSSSRGSYGLG